LKKILILRFSSIGDIVLTTPVVRCLKKQLPGAEIHYLTKPQFQPILASNPYIDKLHVLDKPILQKSLELKQNGFDLVIDLHHNLRTRIIKSVIDAPSFSFDKLNTEKWVMVNLKINLLPNVHIVDRYMETVAPLGIFNDGEGLDYFLPANLPAGEYDLSRLPETYIAFAIGGQHVTKKLPNDQISSICRLIDRPVVLLGGREDKANGDQIARDSGSHVINLCGELSLQQSAYVLKQAAKVITHDTGLMHIAAAFNKEIISVWGNTIPAFGMTPYHGKNPVNNELSEVHRLTCRPCSKIGFRQCPKGHFHCMTLQDSQRIAQFALKTT
jgi:ADP-heptose:LPS heptosyltransferase